MALKYMRPETNLEEKKEALPMSSIYTQLTESDFQLEKELSTLIPTPSTPVVLKPKLTGIKLAILGCFTLGIASLLGVIYVYESLLLEAKQRKALESSHATLSERAVALESAIEEQKDLSIQLRERMTRDQVVQNEIRAEIEKRRSEISDLQIKLQNFETKGVFSAPAPLPAPAPAISSTPAVSQVAEVAPQSASKPVMASSQTQVTAAVMPATIAKHRVLTVNRQFKFAVINTGTEEGSKIGDRFTVERNGKKVGSLQIEKLYDNFAAATISEENQNAPLEVGDSIVKAV